MGGPVELRLLLWNRTYLGAACAIPEVMLIEELFRQGIMTMGPSRADPARQVGTFPPGLLDRLAAERAIEIQKFGWIAGEWSYENRVPATALSPAYSDTGMQKFSMCKGDTWICAVTPDGREQRHITYDPFSRQWMYVLSRGSYGILRSAQGWIGDQIVFSGLMTMIGINCEWRMTWTRSSEDEFAFVNEEQTADGSWSYIDEWRFKRKPGA